MTLSWSQMVDKWIDAGLNYYAAVSRADDWEAELRVVNLKHEKFLAETKERNKAETLVEQPSKGGK